MITSEMSGTERILVLNFLAKSLSCERVSSVEDKET